MNDPYKLFGIKQKGIAEPLLQKSAPIPAKGRKTQEIYGEQDVQLDEVMDDQYIATMKPPIKVVRKYFKSLVSPEKGLDSSESD